MSDWSPYPYGLPPCKCGEHGSDRQRAKYHQQDCERWPFLMRREGREK